MTRAIAKITLCCALFTLGYSQPARSADDWELITDKDDMKVYSKQVTGSSMFAFKGITEADIHIGKILDVFVRSDRSKDWVDRFHATRELSRKNVLQRTFWIQFALPFPVSDRDYVLSSQAIIDYDKKHFTANLHSVTNETAPPDDCCVRGVAHGTYYLFEALPKGRTRLTVEVHTDPKGWLPAWLVNLLQKSWPDKTLSGLIARARLDDVEVFSHVKDWHEP
jgi:hypothetical protein